MSCLQGWPEPVVSVQSLSESGIQSIPERYIKPPTLRPSPPISKSEQKPVQDHQHQIDIPCIDLQNAFSDDACVRQQTLGRISDACREWGFFQVVNHGVSPELMRNARETWRRFFKLPLDVKQEYANSPTTYEGYGSRLGVEKGAKLDWSDYFFVNFLPLSLRNPTKWPTLPPSCRELVVEYGDSLVKLCGILMKVLSVNLGMEEEKLQKAIGGDDIGAGLRVNFYPKCPQPDLTLGLSPHSDPGCMTLLLPDEDVAGLQVLHGDDWITVKPIPDAFIVNIGDQLQVLSNRIYKSVEHRVIVNSEKERVSLAFFYNPKSDLMIGPVKEFVTKTRPALYQPMTFDEYRLYIRTKGPRGKAQVESLTSNTQKLSNPMSEF